MLKRCITHIRAYSTLELTSGEKVLFDKLSKYFTPTRLAVKDVSGMCYSTKKVIRGGCGSMYAVDITSKMFDDLSMVKQHRLVNDVLKDDIKTFHGIQIKTNKTI